MADYFLAIPLASIGGFIVKECSTKGGGGVRPPALCGTENCHCSAETFSGPF
jgi:hypothetical protein